MRSRRRRRKLCARCGNRPARFSVRGRMKADRDHDLCRQCYRSLRDALRARGR